MRKLWDVPPTTVAEGAAVAHALGWEIVPIRPREKVPSAKGWTTASFTPDDIEPGANLGVRLAPPLLDIDCDVPEAAIFAEALLPATLVSGRPGAPRTHLWFGCDTPVPYKAYTDDAGADRTMLVELRAGRERYTLIPPSIHPNGETLTWTGDSLTQIDAETLQHRLALVAALTLISRHWPGRGQRHAAAGALTGMLLAHRIPVETIRIAVRALCQATRDDEVEDRLRHVDSTLAKWEADAPTSGATSLKEILGECVTKATGWLAETWGRVPALKDTDPRLAAFNATHFVVRIGSQVVVGLEEEDGVVFQPFPEFERLYANSPKVGTQRATKLWLEHPLRRSYDRLGFAPPGAPPLSSRTYNLWRGFAVSPDPRPEPERRIARFLEHLHEVIASGDDTIAEYVTDLLADAVQRPGRPIGKALALRGRQGSGKSCFVEAFGGLFGRHFITVSHRDQIVGKFNAHLSGKVVVFGDEAIWGGTKDTIGTLKRLVSQAKTTIERKGVDLVDEPNYVHLFMATNEDWTWPAGPFERRGIVLDVNRSSSEAYFTALWAELESRDFQPALLAYLQARAVDTVRLRRGIFTAALEEQQDLTADPLQSWWRTILDEGTWTGGAAKIPDDSAWPTFVSAAALHEAYANAVKTSGRHVDDRTVFQRRWLKFLPPGVERTQARVMVNTATRGPSHYESRVTWGVRLPSLEACRKAYDEATGSRRTWLAPHAGLLEETEHDV